MLCSSFNEIDPDTYLFWEKIKASSKRKQPEEVVRQWCAEELIRAYGISIKNIEFERPVRMVATQHYIDILVSREGSPSVVIECKRAGDTQVGKGVEQALSYAECSGAEFAIHTNGNHWHVQRRIRGEGCVIPDLPKQIDRRAAEPLSEFLRSMDSFAPLLYGMDDPLSGKEALRLLVALQRFFHGSNLLTDELDPHLRNAADLILRVPSCWGDEPYCRGKFATAIKDLESYRSRLGIGFEFYFMNHSLDAEMQQLHATLLTLRESSAALTGGEVLLLRLFAALAEYGLKVARRGAYPELTSALHQTLREYLDYALLFHLNVAIPDRLENILSQDVKNYCRWAWNQIELP